MRSKSNQQNDSRPQDEFEKSVETKTRRMLKSNDQGKQSPWFGLGMFGLVGWSIALPTVAGVMIGTWIDNHWPSQASWKLTLMFLGVIIGFSMACYWMRKEFNQ